MKQVCIGCGAEFGLDERVYRCPKCGDILEISFEAEELVEASSGIRRDRPISVWRYEPFIPIEEPEPVSMGEGGTRLIKCESLGRELGLKELYVKDEGGNPTGSFKDRGMTVGVSKALKLKVGRVVCASTGNTSSSLAAYAARAGLECLVFIPKGKVALGKLAQAIAYGAKILEVEGNFDQALELAFRLAEGDERFYLLNSINPFRLEGQKTLAFELVEQLGVPDKVIVPVGNAGNISAIWKGFKEFKVAGLIDRLPEMVGVQAEGACPVARAFLSGKDEVEPLEHPETVATAIRIGKPVNWKKALRAVRESNGKMGIVSDEEILEAQSELARREGVFVEPASASTIAMLKKMALNGEIERDEKVVCIATGNGLKDTNVVLSRYKGVAVEPALESVYRVLT